MQPETLYKGHTIVPLCSGGPRYKAHYKITPPGGASQLTYLTAEFATEVGARRSSGGRKKGRRQGAAAAGQVVDSETGTYGCHRGQCGGSPPSPPLTTFIWTDRGHCQGHARCPIEALGGSGNVSGVLAERRW